MSRIDPHVTYAIRSPQTERKATCEEINCEAWRNGWQTTIPVDADSLRTFRDACNGRLDGLKRHAISVDSDSPKDRAVFMFLPGNPCFDAVTHRVRKELYFVGHGAWNNQFRIQSARQHTRPEDWQEDMALHLLRLKEDEERGNRNG